MARVKLIRKSEALKTQMKLNLNFTGTQCDNLYDLFEYNELRFETELKV